MSGLAVGEVHEAGNGLEALAVMGKRMVDVVIADINMPEMDGVEMVERMSRDRSLSRLPVVMVSSDRSERKMERLKELGVRAYLTKPFRPEAFKELVEHLVPPAPPLKTEPTRDLLAALTASSLEEAAFVMVRATDAPVDWGREAFRAKIGFDGPRDGELALAASVDMGVELASSMLGVDPSDAEVVGSAGSALAEVANILCGVLVEQLFGREATCRLGLPRVDRGEVSSPPGATTVTLVDYEGRAMFVSLDLQWPIKRERGLT